VFLRYFYWKETIMPHRAHLQTFRIFSAVKDSCFKERYNKSRLVKDLIAGVTVGIIAIPLAMALGIASGVPPQYGLYTAMIAGFLIALTGGSRFSISGPTAAFVVILHPLVVEHGMGALMVATLISGVLLIAMSVARFGRLIEYIPEPVTLGFTGGIAIVIATLQMKDFLGLPLHELPENYLGKIKELALALPSLHWPDALIGLLTFAVLMLWPKLKLPVPGHLPGVTLGVILSLLLAKAGYDIATIGNRFSFTLADGTAGHGIPPVLPGFVWPWKLPGADGQPIDWSWQTLRTIFPYGISITFLGAIESLLCAVVLDGMTGRRHHANGELLGQGIGNLVVPFFGGITATAAIARSAANYRAGAESPVSAMIHAFVVMLSLLVLAPVLSYLPMASLAALLMMVAWNMSEARKGVELIRKAPRGDTLVYLICLSLTVLFDMVIAITVGILLAALLFMRNISHMTKVTNLGDKNQYFRDNLPADWTVYKINGPLFFAASDRIFSELAHLIKDYRGIVFYMDAVALIDAGGITAFKQFLKTCEAERKRVILCELGAQPDKAIRKAGICSPFLMVTPTIYDALKSVNHFSESKRIRP